ncbi:MAG: hypothetical protein AAF551_03735 [Bacteroidota bacterium]
MRSILFLCALFTILSTSHAQTPIDGLQKNNLKLLESLENEGYEFRSQIITEFDEAHASQDVNIKLSSDYTYVIVALGDSNIPKITLQVKPSRKATLENLTSTDELTGKFLKLAPIKSGRFKISINATELKASGRGFISFMVLRK